MQTLKSVVIVVVLLAVGYGVYIVLNQPPGATEGLSIPQFAQLSQEFDPQGPAVDLGVPSSDGKGFVGAGNLELADSGVTPGLTAQPNSVEAKDFTTLESGITTPLSSSPESPFDTVPTTSEPTDLQNRASQPGEESRGDVAFTAAWQSAQSQLNEGRLADALLTLSIWYGSSDIGTDEKDRLIDLLDRLAGTVIYSSEYEMEPYYKVLGSETINDIAERYNIPVMFLANINDIRDNRSLVPGEKLKIVRGPFRADVDLQRGELTLFLREYYAGRFPISVGTEPAPQQGVFEVVDKRLGPKDYIAANNQVISGPDPANPYGQCWLGLTGSLAIHGSSLHQSVDSRGCISLSPSDARDVFAILSRGSQIRITRPILLPDGSNQPAETASRQHRQF